MLKLLHKLGSAFEHTQPHTGMSECFFLDLKVGFYTPHSFPTSCVLSDLPEILRQPNFNCSRTSVLPTQFENKAHKRICTHTRDCCNRSERKQILQVM